MARISSRKRGQRVNDEVRTQLPPGVTLLRTIQAHSGPVASIAFNGQGTLLASASHDHTVNLWEVESGKLLRTLEYSNPVYGVAFHPDGRTVAGGGIEGSVKVWDTRSGQMLRTFEEQGNSGGPILWVAFDVGGVLLAGATFLGGRRIWEAQSGKLMRTLKEEPVFGLAFHPDGVTMASVSRNAVTLWETGTGKLLKRHETDGPSPLSVAFDPLGETLVSGGFDDTINVCDAESGKLLRKLEGHTSSVQSLAFSSDGRLLASRSDDHTIRLWSCETWETVAVIKNPTLENWFIRALAFHPKLTQLAASMELGTRDDGRSRSIRFWQLDYDLLLDKRGPATTEPVHHTTGKIVLLGDHSVGKSALGHRLIHSTFKEQASTHGQQFWVFPALGQRRADGTECEAVLWDFAGQPDYRLVHALFVDNADLALVLFDASDLRDPLHGVGFWLKQLQAGQIRCPIILVAAQTDRGTCSMTPDELNAFCQKHSIAGPIATSAYTGTGFAELVESMRSLIPWKDKATTVTTATSKRIKDYVLALKEAESQSETIVTPDELRERLQAIDAKWQFTDAE